MIKDSREIVHDMVGSCAVVALALALLSIVSERVIAAETRYKVVDLEAGASAEVRFSGAHAINNRGDVAGWFFVANDDDPKPFVYKQDKGFVALNSLYGAALGINDHGQVLVFGYLPGTSGGTNAWRYTTELGYEPLGTLAGEGEVGEVPNGINNLGQVVGRSDIPERPRQVAFLYTDGFGMVSIGSLGTNRAATAWAINDAGQVTGHSGGDAFLYTAKTGMVSLGSGRGFAINQNGIVAGQVGSEASIYENGSSTTLSSMAGETWANGINDYKIVVGGTYPVRSGFVWSETEGMIRLDTLIEPGWFIYDVWAINNNGQIAGEANGKAVRFDPIPPKLRIQPASTNLVVSWSPAWPGLVLESTGDLSSTNWQAVATGGTNVMSVATSERQQFFRLNLEGIRGLCCAPE